MRSLIFGLIALALSGLNAASVSAQKGKARDDAERYGWTEDLPAAMKEAKRTNKPLVVILRCIP
jgi:gluconate kinase